MTIEELKKWKDHAEQMLSTYKNGGHDMNNTVIGISASNFLDIVKTCLEQKTGEWIDDADKIDAKFGRHAYKCPKCGKYANYFVGGTEVWWDVIKPDFCPNCGMKGETE